MPKKTSTYLRRALSKSASVQAQVELSHAAYQALSADLVRLDATIFQELVQQGYLLPSKRGWGWSTKAQACRTHL